MSAVRLSVCIVSPRLCIYVCTHFMLSYFLLSCLVFFCSHFRPSLSSSGRVRSSKGTNLSPPPPPQCSPALHFIVGHLMMTIVNTAGSPVDFDDLFCSCFCLCSWQMWSNTPLNELDLTKSEKGGTSYRHLPKNFPLHSCSEVTGVLSLMKQELEAGRVRVPLLCWPHAIAVSCNFFNIDLPRSRFLAFLPVLASPLLVTSFFKENKQKATRTQFSSLISL